MKLRIISRVVPVALLALATQLAIAKEISFNDLPGPAKREAQTELKSGTLKKVESVDHQGKTIYALTFQRPDGSSKYIYLNADGTYVRDQPTTSPGSTLLPSSTSTTTASTIPAGGKELQLAQLPDPVRRTVQTETRNGPVDRVLELPNNGNVMYEVFFRLPNGQDKKIYLNPDGTYVKNTQVAGQNTQRTAGRSWDALNGSRSTASAQPLSSPTLITFSQLPTPVQNAFRSEAGASRIQNIQMGQLNGQSVYQAEMNRNGQMVQVRVNSGGTVLSTTQAQSALGSTTQP